MLNHYSRDSLGEYNWDSDRKRSSTIYSCSFTIQVQVRDSDNLQILAPSKLVLHQNPFPLLQNSDPIIQEIYFPTTKNNKPLSIVGGVMQTGGILAYVYCTE